MALQIKRESSDSTELNLADKLTYISNLFKQRGTYSNRFEYIFTIWVSGHPTPKIFSVSLLCDLAATYLKENESEDTRSISESDSGITHGTVFRKQSSPFRRANSSYRQTQKSSLMPPLTKTSHQLSHQLSQERLCSFLSPIINHFTQHYQKIKSNSSEFSHRNYLQRTLNHEFSLLFCSNVHYSTVKSKNSTYLLAYPTEAIAVVCSSILKKELTYMVMGLHDDLHRSS